MAEITPSEAVDYMEDKKGPSMTETVKRIITQDIPTTRDLAAPTEMGTLSFAETGRASAIPLYGYNIDDETKQTIRDKLRAESDRNPGDNQIGMKVELDLFKGKYKLNAFDYRPTLEAYLISKGAPISRRGTSVEDLDRANQYTQDQLAKAFPDDLKYSELDAEADRLLLELDYAWKSRNNDLFTKTLNQIHSVTEERGRTTRGLYKAIEAGLDWRKDLATQQNLRTREYVQHSGDYINEARQGFSDIDSQELHKRLIDYLGVSFMTEPNEIRDTQLLAETIIKMRDLGKNIGDSEIENIAYMYLKGFKNGKYPSEEHKPISSLTLSSQVNEEERTVAAVIPVDTNGKRFTLFSLGQSFYPSSDIQKFTTLAHELQHWVDFGMLKIPGLHGVDNYASGVSTEAAAHLYGLRIYQKLKPYLNQSDPQMEAFARQIQWGGIESALIYGLDYVNSTNKNLHNTARKAS